MLKCDLLGDQVGPLSAQIIRLHFVSLAMRKAEGRGGFLSLPADHLYQSKEHENMIFLVLVRRIDNKLHYKQHNEHNAVLLQSVTLCREIFSTETQLAKPVARSLALTEKVQDDSVRTQLVLLHNTQSRYLSRFRRRT